MNATLLLAGALAAGIGAAHSYLGERYILIRLLRQDLPSLFGSDRFTKRTLRFAWHLTTVAWWGFAAVFVLMASTEPGTLAWRQVGAIGSAAFGVSALVTLAGSRGRHYAWVVFLAIAAAVWYGTR